jgi:hypothetical protein
MKLAMKLVERREATYNKEPWVKFTFVPVISQVLKTDNGSWKVKDSPTKLVIHLPFDVAQNSDLGKLLVGHVSDVDIPIKK